MRGLDENGNNTDKAQVSGTVYIDSLTSKELYEIQARYPDIKVVYNELTLYTVRFWNGDTLLHTEENVAYHTAVEYPGDAPVKDGETDHSQWAFAGWNPDPSVVTGNMDCYAQYEFLGLYTYEMVKKTLEGEYENDRVTSIGGWAFSYLTKLKAVRMPLVTKTTESAFRGCYLLESVHLPSATTIAKETFRDCASLIEVVISPTAVIGSSAFQNCAKLERFDTCETNLYKATFSGCKSLAVLILRSGTICNLANANALENTAIANGTGFIYVPKTLEDGSDGVETYRAHSNWSVYADQIRAIEDYPEICGGEA
jgi:hypothetical protein